jgi:putative transposase
MPLPFRPRGGKRKGAGRPRTLPHPGLEGPGVPHLVREQFRSLKVAHVTLRIRPGVAYLRAQGPSQVLLQAFKDAAERLGMRIAHYSIQGNHLHLVVEADSTEALTRGVQGLTIRIARRLNRRLRRRGAVFADRYHSHVLHSRREVANAVRYVIRNFHHHARERVAWNHRDPLASREDAPLVTPRAWLLREGFRLEPARKQAFFEPSQ